MLRLLLVLCALLVPLAGWAQPDTPDYAAFAGHDYEAMRAAAERLGTSGDPRAATVLGALQGGRLLVAPDHTLFSRNPDGSVVEAASGKPAEVTRLKEIRMNNAVRRAVDAALPLG